jgi:hypothetical protein
MRALDANRAIEVALIYLKVAELQRHLIKSAKEKMNEPSLQFSNQKARENSIKAGFAASFQTKRRKQFVGQLKLHGDQEEAVCESTSFLITLFASFFDGRQVLKVAELFPGDAQAQSLVMKAFCSPSINVSHLEMILDYDSIYPRMAMMISWTQSQRTNPR